MNQTGDMKTENGIPDYRTWVGPSQIYDLLGSLQFNLLTTLGLREHHKMLDIGCGTLRGGRFSIMYLQPGSYHGIEPNKSMLEEGQEANIGHELLALKKPTFIHDQNFTLTTFNTKFDFILAHSILTHTSKQQTKRCLTQANLVMGKESMFLATFMEGPDNYEGDEWVYPGFTSFRRDYIAEVATQCGLTCHFLEWPHRL